MELGAHLPIVDLTGRGWSPDGLAAYAGTAHRLGYRALAANDHLGFGAPWLDGLVALSSVLGPSVDLTLATTVALPVVRGPAQLAKAAAALDLLSGGRFVLGVGPGSSSLDHALAGVGYAERWARFDESLRVLRGQLGAGWPGGDDRFYEAVAGTELTPRPTHPGGLPVWVGSWGSPRGLARVARLGDGWLASALATSPDQVAAGLHWLHTEVTRHERPHHELSCAVATMWTLVTEDQGERADWLGRLGALLDRSPDELAGRVMVGPAQHCADLLDAYATAGVDLLFVWPLADEEAQLERVIRDVLPLVAS
ncbi:Flavin-dependent oxidoreductase, luciferase family (includes alkanesulfonate monooxygenase SsuD and methylene tetrahydromethanopterin reductase) [Pedococcus dokdonensis]|uniref:Flavin-dependent oxidoreductase, luciferase family (Includes alkanesulfonate monooxygenase SsuD and methylene tetrahydromethanopterin reductase) n=1 Tax=Pedococcus dokdonensis TaxID=443156 RepID=A0A1H0TEB8_9MICO|nr:LLM class flavin-dependent oxidoreductase [Pedococcus dokdonensis]SDP52161.1 Flavin-dependent oxidoreductase, luciferase family (includes alkanesulfonate monooxygenase SsuD and methylene tetrahydromethanopterin reductase) [Pedococcus dokdonensis]